MFFSYYAVLNFLKNYSIDEKLLLSHLSAALHSQTFANRHIVSEEKFYNHKNFIILKSKKVR